MWNRGWSLTLRILILLLTSTTTTTTTFNGFIEYDLVIVPSRDVGIDKYGPSFGPEESLFPLLQMLCFIDKRQYSRQYTDTIQHVSSGCEIHFREGRVSSQLKDLQDRDVQEGFEVLEVRIAGPAYVVGAKQAENIFHGLWKLPELFAFPIDKQQPFVSIALREEDTARFPGD